MGKKKKGSKGKKGKGGKKGKQGKKKAKHDDNPAVEVVLPAPPAWCADYPDLVEEFRGKTPQEQFENSAIFRTFRRKPTGLRNQEAILEKIKAKAKKDQMKARLLAGLPEIDEEQEAAEAKEAEIQASYLDPVEEYRKKATAGLPYMQNLPRTEEEWRGNIKMMHQRRFPSINLRRSRFDHGEGGRWGKPPALSPLGTENQLPEEASVSLSEGSALVPLTPTTAAAVAAAAAAASSKPSTASSKKSKRAKTPKGGKKKKKKGKKKKG